MSASSRACAPYSAAPTPQRKRARLEQKHNTPLGPQPDSDVEIVEDVVCTRSGPGRRRSADGYVPCEICGKRISFQSYVEHVSTHDSSRLQDAEQVPCDVCGEMVGFAEFEAHAAAHRAASGSADHPGPDATACHECGALVKPEDLADHMAAHKVHAELVDSELQKSTSEVDITVQLVETARKGGSGLPGNRQRLTVGDAALVRWSDGHWYHAHLVSTYADGRHHVSWDPPYQSWSPEDVAADSVIPRMHQAREVCNFDVALVFVKKLLSMKTSILKQKSCALELVYHWTREENVQKIVDNNLKTPGSQNADGSQVHLINGAAYGSGIYAATSMRFGQAYGGGLPCAFLCLAIPGTISKSGKIGNHDSLQQRELRVFKTSQQLLPLFFTDSQRAANLEECAREIMKMLRVKVLGLAAEEPGRADASIQQGRVVEVWDVPFWWKAKVQKVHANGTYDISWMPPYRKWPWKYGVAADCIRRRA